MNDNDIKEILDCKSIPELIKRMSKFYPTGFDINKIEPVIKDKIKKLEEFAKNNSTLEEIEKLK